MNSIAGGVMQRYAETVSGSYRVKEEDKKLIADFYKSALVGMILDWLNGGMKYDPEQMIRRLGIMLKGNVQICTLLFLCPFSGGGKPDRIQKRKR